MTKKILIDEAVVRQALEALKSTGRFLHHCWCDVQMNEYSFDKLNKQMEIVDAEITALREALQANNKGVNAMVEQVAEPVAWISEVRCVGPEYGKKRYGALPIQSLQPGYYAHTPLYASPQPSKPLTDEQIERELQFLHDEEGNPPDHYDFARAIEAAHHIGVENEI